MGKKTDDLVAVFWIVEKSNIKKRNQILLPNDELYHHSGGNADRAPLRAEHTLLLVDGSLSSVLRAKPPSEEAEEKLLASSPPNQDDETKEEPIKTPPTHLLHLHIFSIFDPLQTGNDGRRSFLFIAERRRQKENAGHGTARLYASEWISTEINIQKRRRRMKGQENKKVPLSCCCLVVLSLSLSSHPLGQAATTCREKWEH
jgi:hypothetical protein